MIVTGAVRRRGINAGSFAQWEGVEFVRVIIPSGDCPGGIEFAGELTDEQQAAVRSWMTATSDADEAARTALAATRDNPDTPPCCAQVIDYLLGATS